MKSVFVLFMVAALATAVEAADISSLFTNLDFDSGAVTTWPFKGFDAPAATEIIGWSNYPAGSLNDAGVEGPGAWWLTEAYTNVYQNAGFMSAGDAAYNMSTYVIQAGDVFFISYIGGEWGWTGTLGQWTATLFYDNPANVIGSYVQNMNSWMPNAVWYTDAVGIAATPASVGGTLGILFKSTGDRIVQFDEVTVTVIPEPATMVLLGLGGLLLRRRK
ncbi:MAG: PEP-CTERM sorting domain-containing protein [Phycisphaerae bacterium]|nr:PEP-CTERM sorting domain-containing protein [Phycisphaerae bacterium]